MLLLAIEICSLYDVRPSENDLVDNVALITEASMRDETLRTSEVSAPSKFKMLASEK